MRHARLAQNQQFEASNVRLISPSNRSISGTAKTTAGAGAVPPARPRVRQLGGNSDRGRWPIQDCRHFQNMNMAASMSVVTRKYLSATMPKKTMAPSHLFDTNLSMQSAGLLRFTVMICHARCVAASPTAPW